MIIHWTNPTPTDHYALVTTSANTYDFLANSSGSFALDDEGLENVTYLLQQAGLTWRPEAVASGSMTERGFYAVNLGGLSSVDNLVVPESARHLLVTSSVGSVLTGLDGGWDGRRLSVINRNGSAGLDVTLANENANSVDENRFFTGPSGLTLPPGRGVELIYHGGDELWYPCGGL